MLDEAGLQYVKIAASNQLDEHLIKSLLDQDAPIDIFGVGTSVITGQPDAALDGVYKLAYFRDVPRIKLSETISKITLPHRKQVYRIYDEKGQFTGSDVISLASEDDPEMMFHPFDPLKFKSVDKLKKEALLKKVMENGEILNPDYRLEEIAAYSKERLHKLPREYKRFFNPHIYKIGLSQKLKEERDRLIEEHKTK